MVFDNDGFDVGIIYVVHDLLNGDMKFTLKPCFPTAFPCTFFAFLISRSYTTYNGSASCGFESLYLYLKAAKEIMASSYPVEKGYCP